MSNTQFQQKQILEFLKLDGDYPITDKDYYFALGYLRALIHEFTRLKQPDMMQQQKMQLYEGMLDWLDKDRHHYTSLSDDDKALIKGYSIHKPTK